VPKTLLAVDDSATMRKVLEITFSGEDYRIVTADSAQAALGKLSEDPKIVLIDTVLAEGGDGYALSKEIRKRHAGAAIVLMSSRHNPYDPAKGKDAGADDFMDKPFDTQQMVEKVRKAAQAREAAGLAVADKPAAAPTGALPTPAVAAPPPGITPIPGAVAARPPGGIPGSPGAAKPVVSRSHTLMFGGNEPLKAPPPAAPPAAAPKLAAPSPAPAPVAARPAASPAPPRVSAGPVPPATPPGPTAPPPTAAAATAPSGGVAGKVNGQLAGKLGDLGLTPAQVDGVLALSREVVERVVWEVVPELAEAIIKEEIARLMKA
jgi:CheY-like chemotaxis protein